MPEDRQITSAHRQNATCGIILVALLLIQFSLLAYLSWSTSPNRTEVGHIGAAVYFWNFGNFDVFHVNPPLTRIIAGMPIALFCNPKYDWKSYSPRPQDRCEWTLGTAFVAANDLADLRLYVFLMRLACLPLVLTGGYFGYRFASELYGTWSGILFLTLWTFSPLVLGWGATICPDVVAASMGIVGLYTFWHWLKNPGWQKAIIAGICLGLMPLAKTTWIIAFPIWGLLFVLWTLLQRKEESRLPVRQFAALFLIALYVINSGYFYDGSFTLLKDYKFISGTLTNTETAKNQPVVRNNRFEKSWIGYVPVPFPCEFIQGIDTQKLDFERGLESYACGIWSDHGWWWYYGYVLLLREPLGLWALTLLALGAFCFVRGGRGVFRDELIIILTGLLIFTFLSSQTGFSIHPRYIIIALPFLYIFVSRLAQEQPTKKWVTATMLVLLLGTLSSSLSFYPYSMSYFNELAGGLKDRPKHLLGSNIDWGQDVYQVKQWIDKHSEAKPLFISVDTAIPLSKMDVEYPPVPVAQEAGWFLISVNTLYNKNDRHLWLLSHDPVATIGYSIYVYHVP